MTSHSRELLIINKRGLHARASAKFVQTVEAYDAAITVSRDGTTVGGNSIMGLMRIPPCSAARLSAIASKLVFSANFPQFRFHPLAMHV